MKNRYGFIYYAFLLILTLALPAAATQDGALHGSQAGAGGVSVTVSASETVADAAAAGANVSWEDIQAAYEYDHSIPLNVEISEEKDMGAFTKIYFSYDSLNGGRVPAVLMMPKSRIEPMKPERSTVEGAYPVMFLMHFHVSDKSLADLFSTWPGYGVAVMAIDGVFRGDRKEDGKDILMPDPVVCAKHMQMQIKDILRGFDVASAWEGLDPGRIGYMGISMGAQTGMVATALDKRIKSILIADGAADYALIFENSEYGDVQVIKKFMDENSVTTEQLVDAFKYVEPAVFAPRITQRPVMLMNGKEDTTMTVPAMEKLHGLVGTKKLKIKWYNSGHILPFDKVVIDALKWFKGTL